MQVQSTKPITVDLSTIGQGKIHTIQWNSTNIAILHRTDVMQASIQNKAKDNPKYFVFINSGGDLNCPLVIANTGKQQLKDICSGYLYDLMGKAKSPTSRVRDLRIPPHQFIDKNTVLIGSGSGNSLFPKQ
jgi:Rieske Fe-S protein